MTYDGHDGTDFALPTLADQARGVAVLAAAPGIVAGTRDGMADALQGLPGSPDVTGRECGNGVRLRHAGGWETQYCHLARGSVAVREGDSVEEGAMLGRVGYSGNAQFPHLHLSVRRDGEPVDPFAPEMSDTCGELPPDVLWAEPLPFPAGGPTDAGFATAVPGYAEVTAGTADAVPRPDEPLVLFGLFFGGRAGDEVHLTITGPGGEVVLDHVEALGRTQSLLFRAAGRRAPAGGWPAGRYDRTVALIRQGEEIGSLTASVEMPAR